MSHRLPRTALVVSACLIVLGTTAPPSSGEPAASTPDLALVGVDGFRSDAADAIRAAGGEIVGYHDEGFFEVDPPSDATAWTDALVDPAIRYAEPEQIGTLDAVPNDPLWADQWGLDRVGAPRAWDQSTGSSDVVVGLVDSGIDASHEDLEGRVWGNAGEIPDNGLDDDDNGYVDDVAGIDCRNDDVDPFDDYFHGTHVAGTIGAIGDNSIGVAGVNWDVRLMALKWTNQFGQGLVADAVECLDYAVDNGAKVINASWGFDEFSQTLADAIDRADAAGVLVITSAGNNARDITSGTPRYPASFNTPNLITVAATGPDDALASFSNWGSEVDLAAPGVDIWSTQPNNDYWVASGTSFSTSYTTGAAALYASTDPGATAAQITERLLSTSQPIPALAGLISGGRLDLGAAIPDVTPPGVPTGLTATARDTQVHLDWDDVASADLDAYTLQRSVDPPEAPTRAWDDVAITTSSDITDRGLANGVTYYYRVSARDITGNVSDPSAEVSATPQPPSVDFPITSIIVTNGTDQGDPIANVAASDDVRHRVLGKPKKSSSTAAWEGSTTIDPSGAVSMTLSFEADASASGTVAVHVRRLGRGKAVWDPIGTAILGPGDTTLSWSTSAVGTYATAAGLVRIKVAFTSSSVGTMFGTDLAMVRVTH